MVSKAKSIRGSVASVNYILSDKEKGDALILGKNGIVGENGSEIMHEFRMTQNANQNCTNNTISIVISPSNERQFSPNQMKQIGEYHLKALGLDKNQYLMTMHTSTGKPHIHIIANRIDSTGKAFKDNFISKRVQDISEKLSKQLGLTTAKDIEKANKISLQPIKAEIKKAHYRAINNSSNFQEYSDMMQAQGIKVLPTINKQGQLQGMKFEHKGSNLTFKASEISKGLGVKDLIENGLKMPVLSPALQKIAIQVLKTLTKEATKGFSLGI